MKTVSTWEDLNAYGVIVLTGEACSLMYRILCDLTARGKRLVERCLSVEIQSENWNPGSDDDPHVASVMLTREMLQPLAVFALLESGCREVWLTDRAVIGIDSTDPPDQVARLRATCNLRRHFAYHGPFQDRNQHQMSGRVR